MQSRYEISNGFPTLCSFFESEPLPAIDPFGRNAVSAVYTAAWTCELDRPDGAGEVAHIVPPHDIVLIANAFWMPIAIGKQESCGLEPPGCEHIMLAARRQAFAAQGFQHQPIDLNATFVNGNMCQI